MMTTNILSTSRSALFIILSAILIQVKPVQAQSADGRDTIHPVQISFVPGLSILGNESAQAVSRFSLNIIGGYTGGVAGLELGGVFNINRSDVRNVQLAGVFNRVGNTLYGVQAAGVINQVASSMSGIQLAGAANRSGEVHGAQFAGVVNLARSVRGAQFAGAVNIARGETGSQIAGVVNVGKNVKGVQLAGLLNIADSSDYPVGLINLIRNGQKSMAVEVDETGTASLVFRSGGRVLYGVLGIGYRFGNDGYDYALEGGLGARLVSKSRFSLNVEAVQRTTTDFDTYTHMASLKILPAFRFGNHLEIFGGPTANVSYADDDVVSMDAPGWVWYRHGGDHDVRSMHGGLIGGIRYVW